MQLLAPSYPSLISVLPDLIATSKFSSSRFSIDHSDTLLRFTVKFPSKTFKMPKSALFVIDIQNDLAGEGFPNTSPHAERIRKNGTEILKRARKAIEDAEKENHPPPLELVFVQHEEPEGPLVRGTDTWKLVFEPDGEKKTERLVSKKDGILFLLW